MGLFGNKSLVAEEGYGEAPIQPNYNQLPNLHFVRILDKVSSRGKRQKRAVLLSSKALVLCQAGSFTVKRLVDLEKVTKAVLQENPRDPLLMGPGEGQALLLRIPDEHDVILAQATQRKAGYGNKLDVERLAQAVAACKKHTKQDFDIKKVSPDEDIFRSAFLIRQKSLKKPRISTFRELENLFETHDPIPETVAVDPIDEPEDLGKSPVPSNVPSKPSQAPSDYYKTLFGNGPQQVTKGGKSTFGNTTPGRPAINGHTGEWRGSNTEHDCSIPGDVEGVLCDHPMPTIPHNHWSCCGAMNFNTFCIREASPPSSPFLYVTRPTSNADRRSGRFSENSAFAALSLDVDDATDAIVVPPACQVCTVSFANRRKFCCRKCGCYACDKCSSHYLRVPGQYGAARVCRVCYTEAGEAARAPSVASTEYDPRRLSAPPSSDGETPEKPPSCTPCDAAVAAAVTAAVFAAQKEPKRKKKKAKKKKQAPQPYPPHMYVNPMPGAGSGYWPMAHPSKGYPVEKPAPPNHAMSYFTPTQLGMWRDSGSTVPTEQWRDPLKKATATKTPTDRFWSGFIEEWDDVSRAVVL